MSDAPLSLPAFDLVSFCRTPAVRESAPVKVALLRGPVYSDDSVWPALIRHRGEIDRFFAEIGIRVTVDEADGYSFLDQAPEGEPGADWPRLLYRDRFTYDVTCVLLVLREWLLSQETKTREERAPLKLDDLLAQLRPFSRKAATNVEKEDKRWREAINKVVALGFLKRWRTEEAFVVRPIVRARLSLDTLTELRDTLEKHTANRTESTEEGAT